MSYLDEDGAEAGAYGYRHRQEREAWRPIVEAGRAYCSEVRCLMPSRWIPPGSSWHLAHDHTDPTGTRYRGPAHAGCNSSEGAARGNRGRRRNGAQKRRSRAW